MKKKNWYRMEASNSEASVYVYDVIDSWFGVSAEQFVKDLAGLDVAHINLYVNSPGGSAFDAMAMTNAMRRHPANITATVDGLAASAASFLILAADEVVMGPGSELMIHDAWMLAMGNAEDMRKTADDLDRISQSIAALYANKAGGTTDEWRDLMKAETWYSAEEAVTAGLADRTDSGSSDGMSRNEFDLSRFVYHSRAEAPMPPLERIAAMRRPNSAVTPVAAVNQPVLPAVIKEEPVTTTATITEAPVAETPTQPVVPDLDIEKLTDAISNAVIGRIESRTPAVPAGVPSSLAKPKDARPGISFTEATKIFAARHRDAAPKDRLEELKATLTNAGTVFDSLQSISWTDGTYGGLGNATPPQWIGELVTKVQYDGLWELLTHADLTSATVQGFVMETEPTGGDKDYAGGAVTSTGAKWTLKTYTADRFAGGDSFDRTPFDFGLDASAYQSYFFIQLWNYYKWRDSKAISTLVNGLAPTVATTKPTNSVIVPVVNAILDGVVNVIQQGGGIPNLAVVTPTDYKQLVKSSFDQGTAFLPISAGPLDEAGFSGVTVVPDLSGTLANDNVLVANGAGITAYELPGSPVRAEQLQVSIGNIDLGLFGYAKTIRSSTNFVSYVFGAES